MKDEQSFLSALEESPNDTESLRSYGEWLKEREDRRGDLLLLELERIELEKRSEDLAIKLDSLYLIPGLDSSWLDVVFPLYIESLITGTFHSSSSPESGPLVAVGDLCRPETPVAIVEAMYVFNEFRAGMHCVITEKLVADGDTVHHGTRLFRVQRPPRQVAGG